MGLPAILKNMNLFHNGVSYVGQIPEVTVPKLAIKLEAYRGAGMMADLGVDMGLDGFIEFGWKAGGHITAIYAGFGAVTHDAELLRWVGAYQDDGTGLWKSVEITVRGRHQEIDPGDAKPGEKGEESIKTIASYYKLTVDGATIVEIDVVNMVMIVNGVDRYAELRAVLGI